MERQREMSILERIRYSSSSSSSPTSPTTVHPPRGTFHIYWVGIPPARPIVYTIMFRGTIHPSASFEEERYIHTLEDAMRGKGCNKDVIIDYLVKINNAQRQMLRTPYKVHYGKDLEETLKKELSGELENVIISLMYTPAKEDALALYKAVKGVGTDEKTLIEILASRSNDEIEAARNTFFMTYNRSLEDAVASDTSGDFRTFLVMLIQGRRDRNEIVDQYQSRMIAQDFAKGVDKKEKLEKFKILATGNDKQLHQIFAEYDKLTGKSFEKLIEKEFSSDAKNLLVALYQIVENRPKFFAQQINNAVKGFGTRNKDLIRILVSRSEIDLDAIKEEYEKLYGKSLLETIHSECKGDYRQALVAIVVGNRRE